MVPKSTDQTKKMGWPEPAKDTGFKSVEINGMRSTQVFEPSMGAFKTVWIKTGEAKPQE